MKLKLIKGELQIERTYGEVVIEENNWVIKRAEPHVLMRLKKIFEFIKKYDTENIKIPLTDEYSHELEWFMKRYPMIVSPRDKVHLRGGSKDFVRAINEAEKILRPDYTPRKIEVVGGELRPSQGVAHELIMHVKRVLIGDDIGLGKTYIGMSLLTNPKCLPMVVVCQTHLPAQWMNKIREFIGREPIIHFIKKRSPYTLPPADIYITKYSCLLGWVDAFSILGHKTVVFDEIQELRRSESAKWQAAKVLSDHSEYCVGLSASPVYNYGDEIFNVMQIIKPNALGSWSDFQREWVSGFREVNNPKALGTYLRENHLMLRRTRKDVGEELEPVNILTQYVDPDEKELKKVEDLAKKLAVSALQGGFTQIGQSRRELDIMVRQATGVSKAKAVAQYAKLFLENGEKIILVGWHRKVYEIWNKELADYKPVMYTGSESPKQKNDAIDKFTKGDSNVFMLSLRSGVGIDGLQHYCSTMIIGELDWSPKVHEQVIGRIDRDGQENPVTVVYVLTNSGSDPCIVDLLGLKQSQATGITDPMKAMERVHRDKSRLEMLARSILDKGML